MNVTRVIAAAGTVLVLAACGSGSTTAPASRAAASTAAPASPAASVDAGTAGRICAALNALAFKGHSGADAIATAATAYRVTKAQVVAAIGDQCQQLKQMIPAADK